MIQIVLNEKKYAEDLIRGNTLGPKPVSDLRILAKYYCKVQQLSSTKIYKELTQVMEEREADFKITGWQELLMNLSSQAKKYPLLCVDSIGITKNELAVIESVSGRPAVRCAFTLLCLAKFRNLINSENNNWINYEFKDIFKMANVQASVKEQCLIIHRLQEYGLITMNKLVNSLSIHVNFIDSSNGENILHVNDFRNLGNEYLLYHGEHFHRCAKCLALVKKRSNNSKYCKDCAEIAKYEQKARWDKKNRIRKSEDR